MACVPAALEEGRYAAQEVAGLTQGREAGKPRETLWVEGLMERARGRGGGSGNGNYRPAAN